MEVYVDVAVCTCVGVRLFFSFFFYLHERLLLILVPAARLYRYRGVWRGRKEGGRREVDWPDREKEGLVFPFVFPWPKEGKLGSPNGSWSCLYSQRHEW